MSETNSKDEQREVVDNKMNLIEFIKSVEQMKLEAIEMEKRKAAEEEEAELLQNTFTTANNKDSKFTSSLRFLSRKSKDLNFSDALSDNSNERKHSAEPSTRLKPSLRMKAFKNRQDTFHSLVSCSNTVSEEVPAGNVNSSSASLTEDLMRLPFVEGFSSQASTSKQKVYNKVHIESQLSNGNAVTKEEPKKRRVLHTLVQADGSVVGFCTEESDEEPGNMEDKPIESASKK